MNRKMRNTLFLMAAFAAVLASCHESLEKRAQREAQEYTAKSCPTPWFNGTRTDSVVFDIPSLTFITYSSLNGKIDNADIINANRQHILDGLVADEKGNTSHVVYHEAGYSFKHVLRSSSDPKRVLFQCTITPKDYGKGEAGK